MILANTDFHRGIVNIIITISIIIIIAIDIEINIFMFGGPSHPNH